MILLWMRKIHGGNQSNWMGLELKYSERQKSLLHIAKIRIGEYRTAQHIANARIIEGAYKSEFPFCKMRTPETRKNVRAERAVQQPSAFFNLAEVSWQAPGGGVKT
ncbi:hypothetical protein AYI69_g1570 [Smittium culicis]|uniref:Uncharacterized protein n=1 Tax=Smittium culicis TaxID=133412 RepID=A0A1R1YPU5_9FUNG|nr:hypothetical protein AYI69_g1570 [Smittium culicis]